MEEYSIEDGFFVWKGRRYATLSAMTGAMRMIPTAEPLITKERPMSIATNIPLDELTEIHSELGFYKSVPTYAAGGVRVEDVQEGGIHPQGGDAVGGVKNDAGKSRVDLLPSSALLEIGKVMEFGARKYAPNNWRKGFDWSRLYGAALRHLLAHKDGESTDKETGLSHLAHASCCLLFLLTHELEGLGHDDRPGSCERKGTDDRPTKQEH